MTPRIAIAGAGGGVGSSVAYNLLLAPESYPITLVDGRSGMAASHEMDLQQVVAAGATGSVAIVERAAVAEADVLVVSAATPLTVNRSRAVYLHDNAQVVRTVADALPVGWPGVLVMVTNPVDALVTWLARERPDLRVVGYTANDGLRLRTVVGQLLGVPSSRVDAWVLGEHGDHCVPLLSRIAVDGERVALTAEQRAAAADFVRSWYVRHVALDSGRSSTWTTGHGVARMVRALGDDDPLWPASVVLDGAYGVRGVALSAPVALGSGAVREWPLDDGEARGMRAAADAVRAAADAL